MCVHFPVGSFPTPTRLLINTIVSILLTADHVNVKNVVVNTRFLKSLTRVHYCLRNNITYKQCCLIMRMIIAISYFAYLSEPVRRDRHQPENEQKIFILWPLYSFRPTKNNRNTWIGSQYMHFPSHHITYLSESVPPHFHTIITLLLVGNNVP